MSADIPTAQRSTDTDSTTGTGVIISDYTDSEHSVRTGDDISIHGSQNDRSGISIRPSDSTSRAQRNPRARNSSVPKRTHPHRPRRTFPHPPQGMDLGSEDDMEPYYPPYHPSYPPYGSYPRYSYPWTPQPYYAPSYTTPYYNSYMAPNVAPYIQPYQQRGIGPYVSSQDHQGKLGLGQPMPSHGMIPYPNMQASTEAKEPNLDPPHLQTNPGGYPAPMQLLPQPYAPHPPMPHPQSTSPPRAEEDHQKLDEKFAKLEKALAEQKAKEDEQKLNEKFAKFEKMLAEQNAEGAAKQAEMIKQEAEMARRTSMEMIAKAAARIESVTATSSLSQLGSDKNLENGGTNGTRGLIFFKDAVGRKFTFPFERCKTWSGMESLIVEAFIHVDLIGQHVIDGHYDLMSPNGEIILPSVWHTVIEPQWTIKMTMWPISDSTNAPQPSMPSNVPLPTGITPPLPRPKKKKSPVKSLPTIEDSPIVIEPLPPKERDPEKPIFVPEPPQDKSIRVRKPPLRKRSPSPISMDSSTVCARRRPL